VSPHPDWDRVQEIFHAALARQPVERARYLTEACGDDHQLREEVLSLLAAHERGGPVRDPTEPGAPELPGRIGEFRILEKLGEGGMGLVYLAERTRPDFTQRVALKVMRAGFVDERVVRRLAAERRILSRLEHPGIARLIDGGTTPAGQPYVAMEYVLGVPLLDFCAREHLSVTRRLRLFLGVCDAVHYAHQQLVVHRDLKPANILVTTRGRPKLLDFGIAKLLATGDDADPLTRSAAWMTPAYASPEQASGAPVSTCTDVYALGILLYEMLVGRRPYDVPSASPAEIQRVICETVPIPPSAVPADRRQRRRLRGDLDTIVLKALAKEPARRYGSVEQLAEDLRRHLDRRPVLAQRDSVWYRTSKFLHRHRTGLVAAGLVGAALIGGIATTAWQASVAGRERDRAEAALEQNEDVVTFLTDLFQASDPTEAISDTLAARELLRRGTARAEELEGQPVVQARLLDVLGRIYDRLGQYDRAHQMLGRALGLRREVLGPLHHDVAESLDHLGLARRDVSDFRGAVGLHRAALAIETETLGPTHPDVVETLMNLAFVLPYLGRFHETEALYQRAADITMTAYGPDDPRVATVLIPLAAAQRRVGRLDAAESSYRESLRIRLTRLDEHDPAIAESEVHLGDFLREVRGRSDEAQALYRRALEMLHATLGPDHPALVHPRGSLAETLSARGDHAGAESLYRETIASRRRVYGAEHLTVAAAMTALAQELGRDGRYVEAESVFARTLAMENRLVEGNHTLKAFTLSALGWMRNQRGDFTGAERVLREEITMRQEMQGPEHHMVAAALGNLGAALAGAGRRAAAESAFVAGLGIVAPLAPAYQDLADTLRASLSRLRASEATLD